MQFFNFVYGVQGILVLALFLVKLYALVDAILRPAPAYLAADKQTKTAWMWILGLTVVAQFLQPSLTGLLSLIGTIAALVYILDVKPALAALSRRR